MAWLLCLCLCLLAGWTRANSGHSGEIDLIFPRNDTFAPMALMPVVFAVQNPKAIEELHTYLEYGVYPLDRNGSNALVQDDLFHSREVGNESIPLIYSGIANTVNTSQTWEFWWRVRYLNCSTTDDLDYYNEPYPWVYDHVDGRFHLSHQSTKRSLIFTTREGGIEPNLTTIDAGYNCSDTQAFISKPIADILQVPQSMSGEGLWSCPQLSTPVSPPTPNPCRASLSPEAESSILAQITREAEYGPLARLFIEECRSATPVVKFCPAKPTEDSAKDNIARGHDHAQAALLAVMLAFILAIFAVIY